MAASGTVHAPQPRLGDQHARLDAHRARGERLQIVRERVDRGRVGRGAGIAPHLLEARERGEVPLGAAAQPVDAVGRAQRPARVRARPASRPGRRPSPAGRHRRPRRAAPAGSTPRRRPCGSSFAVVARVERGARGVPLRGLGRQGGVRVVDRAARLARQDEPSQTERIATATISATRVRIGAGEAPMRARRCPSRPASDLVLQTTDAA